MFDKFKDKLADTGRDAAPSSPAKVVRPVQQSQQSGVAPPAAKSGSPETISSIGPGMTIVGRIVGDGTLTVFGRVEGELQASNVLICEGARVEGNVLAQELTISGSVKGTIHAVRVKLHGTAEVDGDVFHQSLSIEENARFEGSSRREENPTDIAPNIQITGSNPQSQAQPLVALIDANRKLNGRPDSDKLGAGFGDGVKEYAETER
ncbi:MAG: polymer-forming cytoskeletal protein [Xanthobacteraceae bacterium]